MKKILMKKFKYRKNSSRICLAVIFLMSKIDYRYILQKKLHLKQLKLF